MIWIAGVNSFQRLNLIIFIFIIGYLTFFQINHFAWHSLFNGQPMQHKLD
jgi:hypothetical protein